MGKSNMRKDFVESMFVDINAKTISESFLDPNEAIEALEGIKPMDYEEYNYETDIVKETEFYQQIMRNLQFTRGLKFSDEQKEKYKEILNMLGCKGFKEWQEITGTKYPKGMPVSTLIAQGDNGAAVKWIEGLMNKDNALFDIVRDDMLKKGRYGLRNGEEPLKRWISESKQILEEMTNSNREEER